MRRIWAPMGAVAALALTGCISGPDSRTPYAAVASVTPPTRPAPVKSTLPPPSMLEAMRGALPSFDIPQHATLAGEVSVIRDLIFDAESSILSQVQVVRLEPLKAYLRANPKVNVRIEGYGDGGARAEREGDIALSRAYAVARALLTDIQVNNDITSIAVPLPDRSTRRGHADVTFILPAS